MLGARVRSMHCVGNRSGLFEWRSSTVASEPEAAERGNGARQENNQRIISTDTAAIVDAINHQQRANRVQEKREDDERRTRETITMFIIAITGGAIILQVSEMKKAYGPISSQVAAALQANEINRAALRAHLSIPETPQSTIRIRDNKFDIKLQISNTGESTARGGRLILTLLLLI